MSRWKITEYVINRSGTAVQSLTRTRWSLGPIPRSVAVDFARTL